MTTNKNLGLSVYATGTQTIRRKNDFIQTCWLKRIGADKEKQLSQIPPRLAEQPIFYPVLNEQYATEIASSWNVKYNEDHRGYVTKFEVDDQYCGQFEVHQVGGPHHKELWVPAEKLDEFNEHIIGVIHIISEFSDI
ncbi:hypothetical protein [Clostridium sp. AM58-1XD]|uniref:hypothetical protein n=1 Tax=Clostridium sp. AM58-1XD TaxID=2292307 RepID=UPI001FA86D12|nr:hypothetical protein [Clostridium sp. AM58-1XD]